jgi:hypothetical protein
MSTNALFQRFVEHSPVTVMVQAILANVYSTEAIDELFVATAKRQYEGELLFSAVVDLLSLVVWRQKKSVSEAYQHAREEFDVSLRSVYNKLNGTETSVCRALVQQPAQQLTAMVDLLNRRPPKLAGYQTRIIDGNKLTSTDHRLQPLRKTKSGPLPGMALAVLDPDRMLIADLFCCEDGEAQERRIFPEVVVTAERGQLWIGDRNFCTTGFLFGLAERGACFLIRQHASTLSWDEESSLKKAGKCETGLLFEQLLHLKQGDNILPVRCVKLQLDEPIESGETEIRLLTNLPPEHADAQQVAELYLTRWTIENVFQEIEQSLRSEINTLGYPGAALLGFAIAMLTYNTLSVIKWAIEREHAETPREKLSGYYLASIISSDYGGMLIALPDDEWSERFAELRPRELTAQLRAFAKHVRPAAFLKTIRGPKRKPPPRTSGNTIHHVSTAELLKHQN